MRLNDAVDPVTGEVFRDGWSRVRGSMQGLHAAKKSQLLRAAAGHRPAVFKAIRDGGTDTKSKLASQLEYLTTKSTHIADSSGFLDGKAKLEAKDIRDLTERFAKRWTGGFKPKFGQTNHLLMSFPIGTQGEDVRDIATDVAERFFQTEQGHFDYIIAVHEDRDHPHAHLVLNRRSQEGEFFYLRRDHRFNYDDFRLAMVEEAEKYRVRLEATRRLDRGVVHYPARTSEVYAAKEEGRAPRERERVGADLTRTLAEIANTRTVYHALVVEASREAREAIADALFRSNEVLAQGGQIERAGDIYMAEEQSFEDLRSIYAEKLGRVQGMIAKKPDAERPVLEKRLIEIQTQIQHMQPLGFRSSTLSEAPSEGGIYSEANIDASQRERLATPDLRSRIDTALLGTGLSTSQVVARIETGASNAALEHQWIADDLSKVAEARDLNLERRADLEQARDILNDVHVELGRLLERENVLRRDGAIEESREVRVHLTEDRFEEAANAVRLETPIGERNEAKLETPELDRVLDHERAGELSAPFETEAERDAFRDEISRVLDVLQLDRLTSGDAEALDKVLEDRLDRLYVAKVYLQSDAATANTEALRQVVEDLADAEHEKHRDTDLNGETERGQVH